MRLRNSMLRIASGENSNISDMAGFLVRLWTGPGRESRRFTRRYTRSTAPAQWQSQIVATQPRSAVPCGKPPDTIPERQRLTSPRSRENAMSEATRIPPAAVELELGCEEFQN